MNLRVPEKRKPPGEIRFFSGSDSKSLIPCVSLAPISEPKPWTAAPCLLPRRLAARRLRPQRFRGAAGAPRKVRSLIERFAKDEKWSAPRKTESQLVVSKGTPRFIPSLPEHQQVDRVTINCWFRRFVPFLIPLLITPARRSSQFHVSGLAALLGKEKRPGSPKELPADQCLVSLSKLSEESRRLGKCPRTCSIL